MKTKIISNNTTLEETVKWIKKLAIDGTKNEDLQRIAKEIASNGNVIEDVYNYAHNNVTYYPTPENRQIIRPVFTILRDGKGNCVDYTILQSALLLILNVPHVYRLVSYDSSLESEHIYIVAQNKILDPVIGQKQDGTEINSLKESHFNKEIPYISKKDVKMSSLEILQGVRNIDSNIITFPRGRVNASRVGFLGVRNMLKNRISNKKIIGTIDWSKVVNTAVGAGSSIYTAYASNQNQQQATKAIAQAQANAILYQAKQNPQQNSITGGIPTNTILIVAGVAVAGIASYMILRKKK